jgi:uncharacterized protein YndB with AHSA1/START domain
MADTTHANSAAATHDPDVAGRTLVIDRIFKASPDKVFKAWTDPAILVQWYGPEGFHIRDLKIDARPGGAHRGVMVAPDGNAHTASGVYREIDPPKRLVMTWAWEDEKGMRGHETVIEITFHAAPGGTRMHLVQQIFETAEQRDGHREGWNSSFNKLERLFA